LIHTIKKILLWFVFHENEENQANMMHKLDEDEQVKEWQINHSGNPPRFASRIKIQKFTNEILYFSNL